MNKVKSKRVRATLGAILIALLCVGCKSKEKEKHIVEESGVEWGVRVEVMLKDGGTAILVCPKFNSAPISDRGNRCYLDSYDKRDT